MEGYHIAHRVNQNSGKETSNSNQGTKGTCLAKNTSEVTAHDTPTTSHSARFSQRSHTKEGYLTFCNSMNGPGDYYAK